MLNYMRAELWKVLRRRYFYVVLGVLVAGECLAGLSAWVPAGRSMVLHMAGILVDLLPAGLFFALLMVDMVFHDQYRQGTLKNELSFGMPRTRIYLGKTLSALLVGLLMAGIILACFCGLIAARGLSEPPDQVIEAMWQIFCYLSCGLPLWIGGLGLASALHFLCKNGTVASIAYLVLLVTLPVVFGVAADNQTVGSVAFRVLDGLRQWNLAEASGVPEGAAWVELLRYMARNWLIGMGWFWGSTAVGLVLFRRQNVA